MLIKERGGGEFGLSGTDLTSYSTDFYMVSEPRFEEAMVAATSRRTRCS